VPTSRASGPGSATSLLGANKDHPKLHPLPLPESYERRVPPFAGRSSDSAYNVAFAYASIVDDMKLGTERAPNFGAALELHRFVNRIEQAALTGERT
jgi:hypothetical protein